MKKTMKTVENLFCAGYLTFAIIAGVIFASRGNGRCAIMTFLLVSGDAFHLIPRIISNMKLGWENRKRWLGLGNLISSITMTLFYVVLAKVMDYYAPLPQVILSTLVVLSAIRICLCLSPANNWFDDGGSQKWRCTGTCRLWLSA